MQMTVEDEGDALDQEASDSVALEVPQPVERVMQERDLHCGGLARCVQRGQLVERLPHEALADDEPALGAVLVGEPCGVEAEDADDLTPHPAAGEQVGP